MNKLAAVNIVLRGSNLGTVATLDTKNKKVAEAIAVVDEWTETVLSEGNNFNVRKTRLQPNDDDNRVAVPDSMIQVIPVTTYMAERLVIKGGYLYNRELDEYHTEAIDVWVIDRLDFDDIPAVFQDKIARNAALTFALNRGETNVSELARQVDRVNQISFMSEDSDISGLVGNNNINRLLFDM